MKKLILTQGKFALVDDEDFACIAQFKWYAAQYKRLWYAQRAIYIPGPDHHQVTQLLHRAILGIFDPAIHIDHEDHDGLNNQKTNLRTCTQKQNQHNKRKMAKQASSQFKGVSWYKPGGLWRVQINAGNGNQHLGYFANEIDAAKAYDSAARQYFGEFAFTNLPETQIPA